MPFRPSPGPWRIEDYKGKGYQILASDDAVVALLHYPGNTEAAANCKLVLKSLELLSMFKSMKALYEILIQNPRTDPLVLGAERLLAELEIRDPVKKTKPPDCAGG